MPRLPINYNNAVVYKICCKDVNITNIYIGSTTNFKNRKTQHKSSCNNKKNKAYNLYVYEFIRLNGGWNNFDMIEIEKVIECNDANELRKKERFYIETLKAELNKNIPTRTMLEYRIDNKDEIREKVLKYHKENEEKIKDYYKNNKKKIKDYYKVYNDSNKEKHNNYRQVYYIDKKEHIQQYNDSHKEHKRLYDKLNYEKKKLNKKAEII